MSRRILTIGLAIGLVPPLTHAFELADGRLHIHGFASQAVVHSSANRYFGNSPSTSLDFTELGLNTSYQLDPRLFIAGQILSRRAGEMYDGTPSLDYALIDFTPIADAERRAGLRLGRIKNPIGLYNETRDVPFTRPGIFLPQAVYHDKMRNVLLSYDGVMFYGDLFNDHGNLSLALGAGRSVLDENVEWVLFGTDFDGDLKAEGLNWKVGSLWYSTPTETFKIGLSALMTEMAFDAGPASPVASGSIDIFDWIASIQYNAERWTLSAEYARGPTDWRDFGPFFPFERQVVEGYYLQGAYRLWPNLEIMTRYEEGFADRKDRTGRDSSDLTGGLVPPFDFFSKIWTLGLRWDIYPHAMLRLEYQRHDGTYALSIRENPDPNSLVRGWDVFAASVSVRF